MQKLKKKTTNRYSRCHSYYYIKQKQIKKRKGKTFPGNFMLMYTICYFLENRCLENKTRTLNDDTSIMKACQKVRLISSSNHSKEKQGYGPKELGFFFWCGGVGERGIFTFDFCDLELWPSQMVLMHYTPSNDGEHYFVLS